MSRLGTMRSACPLLFLALSLVSGSSLAGGPMVAAPVAGQQRIVPNPPPGWPHNIYGAGLTTCNRNPAPHEVIIYRDPGFGGPCAAMVAGFYPYPQYLGVGDDAISSIKLGTGVRAHAFQDPTYGGGYTGFSAGSSYATIGGGFDDKISSMRVEPGDRHDWCDDLREGEIALYRDPGFRGDCVVLAGDGQGEGGYAYPENMGIANDSISSIKNNSSRKLVGYWDPAFKRVGIEVPPHSSNDQLPQYGVFTHTVRIDDNISSVQMLPP